MLRKVSALLLVLVFSMGIAAQAAGPAKVPTRNISLTFDGTTAICKASVQADKSSDTISAIMKLWHDGSVIKTWKKDGKAVVRFNETASVVRGETYKLTLDATINGTALATRSVTKVCP